MVAFNEIPKIKMSFNIVENFKLRKMNIITVLPSPALTRNAQIKAVFQ